MNVGIASLTIPSLYFKKIDDAKLGKRLGEGEKKSEPWLLEASRLEPNLPRQTIPNCF